VSSTSRSFAPCNASPGRSDLWVGPDQSDPGTRAPWAAGLSPPRDTRAEVELTIRILRRRLQVALEQDASRAIIDTLRETLQMFETGRIPRRYDYRGSSVKRR